MWLFKIQSFVALFLQRSQAYLTSSCFKFLCQFSTRSKISLDALSYVYWIWILNPTCFVASYLQSQQQFYCLNVLLYHWRNFWSQSYFLFSAMGSVSVLKVEVGVHVLIKQPFRNILMLLNYLHYHSMTVMLEPCGIT